MNRKCNGLLQSDYESAVTNRGNLARIKELFGRARRGERLTLGFLGGSITQGFCASGRSSVMQDVYTTGGKRPFPRRNLSSGMQESVQPTLSSAVPGQKVICWRTGRTLSLWNMR